MCNFFFTFLCLCKSLIGQKCSNLKGIQILFLIQKFKCLRWHKVFDKLAKHQGATFCNFC